MNFLSYDKNKRLEFHHKKSCGLWLIVVAFVIAVATFVGGKQIINMPLFSIGYVVSFLSINMNKKLVNKLSTGSSTEFQNKIAKYSVFLLFILMFLLGGPFFATENWRLVWLGALLATALHFFSFLFCAWKFDDSIRNIMYYQCCDRLYFSKCGASSYCLS